MCDVERLVLMEVYQIHPWLFLMCAGVGVGGGGGAVRLHCNNCCGSCGGKEILQ